MSLFRRAMMAAAAASAPPAFSYDDVPNQLLRINSLEGSLAGSGGVLTSVTDVSGAGEVITVTGTPTLAVNEPGLNDAPAFRITQTGGVQRVVAPNIDRANIVFVATVFYRPDNNTRYLWDADDGSGRHWSEWRGAGDHQTHTGSLTTPGEPSVGRKCALLAWDGVTASELNGVAFGVHNTNNATGLGITFGQAVNGSFILLRIAFVMMCSTVPDLATRQALRAKLLQDFG